LRAFGANGTRRAGRTGRTLIAVERELRNRRRRNRLARQQRLAVHRHLQPALVAGERAGKREADSEQAADDRIFGLGDRVADLVAAGFRIEQLEGQIVRPRRRLSVRLEPTLIGEIGELSDLRERRRRTQGKRKKDHANQ
jgi:hypothetical protein